MIASSSSHAPNIAGVDANARFAGVVSGSSTLVRQVADDLAALSRTTPALSITFAALGDDAGAFVDDAPGRGIPVAVRVDVSGPAALVAPVRAFLVSLDDA